MRLLKNFFQEELFKIERTILNLKPECWRKKRERMMKRKIEMMSNPERKLFTWMNIRMITGEEKETGTTWVN